MHDQYDETIINAMFESMSKKYNVAYTIEECSTPFDQANIFCVKYGDTEFDIFMDNEYMTMVVRRRYPGKRWSIDFDIRDPSIFNEDHIHNSITEEM